MQPRPATLSQSTIPPHPSVMTPHWAPALAQVAAGLIGVHAGSQRLNTVLQTWPAPHGPQSVVFDEGPQPNHAVPHW
jgi:hypothetical protein